MVRNEKKRIIYILFFVIYFGINNLIQANRAALISIPKCGTHLLLKLLRELTGNKKPEVFPKGWCLLDDKTMQLFFRNQVLLRAHAICSAANINKINVSGVKTFFIYRDPRDQIISTALWIKKNSQWAKYDLNLLIDELITDSGRIWCAIFDSPLAIWQSLMNITTFYNLYLPWQFEPYVYTATFEKLVGKRGGGDDEMQLSEIIAIARHMGFYINRQQALVIAKDLFGKSATFREGKIGAWKKYFLKRHKIAFKKIAGQLLIDLGYEKDLNW